jgi:ABC-type polysaccharide/polyol phosphate transport system, ATPase component
VNAITVNNIAKVYRLYDKPIDRLKESISITKKNYHKDFYALSGVSFNVKKGECVGIIGTNGSGKSTILKIITGVLTPSSGNVEVEGRISALLELGAGFNMDYTGIENIYMNGTMMGYSKEDMSKKIPEILEFADIGDFVHQPVKTYSSGMFVRLAFALAINVEPEILIVDEALSVGDVFFQAKCYKRMDEIRKNGTTILMVTHDMGSILKYCNKVVLLNKGEFVAEGIPNKMVDLYKKILANQMDSLQDALEADMDNDFSGENSENNKSLSNENIWKNKMTLNTQAIQYGDNRAIIEDIGIFDNKGNITNLLLKNETFTIKMKVRFNNSFKSPIFAYTIKDKRGTELTGTNTLIEEISTDDVNNKDVYVAEFKQKMTLQGGEYLLSLGCTGFENGELVVLDRLYDVANITVISNKNTVGIYDMQVKVAVSKES